MVLKYFAYGSNLHSRRFRERVASGRLLGVTELIGHSLRFHKRGRDGSGKCNAWPTGRQADRVIGVLYEMAAHDKGVLDAIEGVGKGYDLVTRYFLVSGKEHEAFFYQAHPEHIDNALRPFTWYKALVVHGCRAHRLPQSYIRRIEEVEALRDADAARRATHHRILEAGGPLSDCFHRR
jgi:hypothetical protein